MRPNQLLSPVVGFVAVILCNVSIVGAEPEAAREFYEHNYAATIGGQKGTIKTEANRRMPAVKWTAATEVDSAEHADSVEPDRAKRRRLSVSVYVNSIDAAHFDRTLEEILRLHDTKTVRIISLSHIGDYRTLHEETQKKLASRGIMTQQLDAAPKQLSVTVSPAWCVYTPEGLHVVEGYTSLKGYIDAWGEFNPHPEEKASEEQKLAGF